MDLLTKIIQTLTDEQYVQLLDKVGVNEHHNNYITLKWLRENEGDPEVLTTTLKMSKGAFNTFKSRLLKRISAQLGTLEENTISQLKEETARTSQLALQNEREVSIRILRDLEKKLVEYDLSAELSIVYKYLARLHRFYPEYDHYEMQYKKYVAFSLTVTKAEDQLYDFIFYLSHFHLNHLHEDKNKVYGLLLEIESSAKLYKSHRLYVIFNIAKIYYDCSFLPPAELALKEIETEEILHQFTGIFARYEQDAFYQNLQHIVPFLFFEYYVRVGNSVKANHYLTKINTVIGSVAHRQLWPFFITQTITSIVTKFVSDGDKDLIFRLEEKLLHCFFPSPEEAPHYICYARFRAMVAFYKGNYVQAAKIINDLRNDISLKNFEFAEVELKLFQAFQYALENDAELAERLLASVKRQVTDDNDLKPIVKLFGKAVSLIIKNHHSGNEKEKIVRYWRKFKEKNDGRILYFIRLSLIEI
jgi:hypothetical protein